MKVPTKKVDAIDQDECCLLAAGARMNANLKQSALAQILGYSTSYISELENGGRPWTTEKFNRWLEACKKVK